MIVMPCSKGAGSKCMRTFPMLAAAILLLTATLFSLLSCRERVAPDVNVASGIEDVLNDQKSAWNRGDIVGFMQGYLHAPDLVFQSNGKQLRGWQAMLDRYRTNYAGERMGVLDFTDIEITPLSEQSAYVIGRYEVKTTTDVSEGFFTLVFRRTDDGWKIVHDHTSSTPGE